MENHGSETRTSSFIQSTKSGMLEFMVVFVAATVNAIVISFLISLAAVGGFYVDFFACMEIMYLGFLFITAFVTFTIPMSSIIVALVAAGPTKVYLVDALGIALHHDVAGGLSQHVTKDYANRLSILY
ncbi:hypothetical protein E3N88_43282 [Mikania micrantha]|uniref:Uncharacterized protein n=1 Tax=Mikania micrantha TaxID=192012 RepID=A0A5N6LFH2_9ASTR|nr:hypothetical protein E3N88_43282 [Mikania micrantha]